MKIRRVAHKGLRRFVEKNDPSGLPAAAVEKIRNIVSYLQEIENIEELRHVRSWRAHRLTGDRRATWSLSVTRNWRITLRLDGAGIEIVELDYEDYH
jgi:proteic killer suppression protein